jgi:hypothetical protein
MKLLTITLALTAAVTALPQHPKVILKVDEFDVPATEAFVDEPTFFNGQCRNLELKERDERAASRHFIPDGPVLFAKCEDSYGSKWNTSLNLNDCIGMSETGSLEYKTESATNRWRPGNNLLWVKRDR